jgi:hypothetical protein
MLFPLHWNLAISPSATSKVFGSAGVSALADLQGVASGFDPYVDGLVQVLARFIDAGRSPTSGLAPVVRY